MLPSFRRIRESLFFIPSAMLLLCIVLAIVALVVDDRVLRSLDEAPPLLMSSTVDGGRAIASAVAGATITVAAIVFSVTALSTQMASSQYSPRSLGGFFEDPLQQATIGLVVGTFTYSLVILAGLSDVLALEREAVPSLSVTLTIALGVTSAVGIVAYINHSLRRMTVDSVVRRIADAALKAVRNNLSDSDEQAPPEGPPQTGDSTRVDAESSGWVVGLAPVKLVYALPAATSVKIEVRMGEPVSEGDQLATIWPKTDRLEEIAELVRASVKVNAERSLERDPTFGIRQLVDIALRALSPGVNDPTTAVDVIHHLKPPIREVLLSDPPRRVHTAEGDRRVYLAETPSRSDYVHLAFSEIRLSSEGQPTVLRALLEVLDDLLDDMANAEFTGRVAALEEEMELTLETARRSNFPEPDLRRVIGREGI